MKVRTCMEPGCAENAEIHLPSRSDREWLCRWHAQAIVIVIAREERDEYLGEGGKLN